MWVSEMKSFIAGAAFEGRRLATSVRASLGPEKPKADRIISGAFAAGLAALAVYAAWQYAWRTPAGLQSARLARQEAVGQRRTAYDWLAKNAAPDELVISYEDAALYLHTGLQGMRPINFSTAALFLQDKSVLEDDLSRLNDVAKRIGASYWVVSPGDFENETGTDRILPAVDALLADQPVVLQDGAVRIHRLAPKTPTLAAQTSK